MSEWKDKIRLSLGLIQEKNGNNPILESLTEIMLKVFMFSVPKDQGEIWTRNSHVFEAHIPLLSDLDLTLINSTTETAKRLHHERRRFLLVGEINFYHPEIIKDILHLANPYELMRDPELLRRLNLKPQTNENALTAFFARQIQSDQKWLQSFPEVRQKKWRYLSELMNLPVLKVPSNKELLKQIKDKKIRHDLNEFLSLTISHNEIFKLGPSAWNYLFPNFYIWKHTPEEETALKALSPLQKGVLIEQLKWEFWGIGCHFYWLPKEVSINHLERMLGVYQKLDPRQDDLNSMNRIIGFIKQQ